MSETKDQSTYLMIMVRDKEAEMSGMRGKGETRRGTRQGMREKMAVALVKSGLAAERLGGGETGRRRDRAAETGR